MEERNSKGKIGSNGAIDCGEQDRHVPALRNRRPRMGAVSSSHALSHVSMTERRRFDVGFFYSIFASISASSLASIIKIRDRLAPLPIHQLKESIERNHIAGS